MNDMEAKPSRIIDINEVKRRVNLSKATIYRRMADGTFPKRCPDGWLESDIDNHINNQVILRDGPPMEQVSASA
jgi:predicted DNA-binding transcriptional regulator AlpA